MRRILVQLRRSCKQHGVDSGHTVVVATDLEKSVALLHSLAQGEDDRVLPGRHNTTGQASVQPLPNWDAALYWTVPFCPLRSSHQLVFSRGHKQLP